MVRKVVLALVVLGLAMIASAGERGTAKEAVSLVDKAVRLLSEKGPDELIRVVNLRKAPYTDRDLYLFVIGPDEKIVAHGFDPARIGITASDLYDGDGQPYGSLMLKYANAEGRWLAYRASDPITGKMADKKSWVRRHDGYIIGCGVYE